MVEPVAQPLGGQRMREVEPLSEGRAGVHGLVAPGSDAVPLAVQRHAHQQLRPQRIGKVHKVHPHAGALLLDQNHALLARMRNQLHVAGRKAGVPRAHELEVCRVGKVIDIEMGAFPGANDPCPAVVRQHRHVGVPAPESAQVRGDRPPLPPGRRVPLFPQKRPGPGGISFRLAPGRARRTACRGSAFQAGCSATPLSARPAKAPARGPCA